MRSLKSTKGRPYRQVRRAERYEQVHHALARAAFELHETVGPAQTTISAIAERAGVQRLTVYRHFANEEAVFAACTAVSFAEVPPPDPDLWKAIADPEARLRAAIREMYEYYRKKARLLANLERDAELPAVAAALDRRRHMLGRAVDILEQGLQARSAIGRRLRRAVLGHVLEFSTWRSLTAEQALSQNEACILAAAIVAGVDLL
jgi:AcrR family transcriptional regulator